MSRKTKKKISLANSMRLDGDGPTPERLAKIGGVTILQRQGGARVAVFGPGVEKPVGADGVVRVPQTPLDRLEARRQLDPADPHRNTKLHEAGDRLRHHWYLAGLSGIGSIDLNRSGGGSGDPAWLTPTSERAAHHRDRFRRAREQLGPDLWGVACAVICAEEDLTGIGRRLGFGNDAAAAAVALDRLRRGLAELADFFGILPRPPANENRPELWAVSA